MPRIDDWFMRGFDSRSIQRKAACVTMAMSAYAIWRLFPTEEDTGSAWLYISRLAGCLLNALNVCAMLIVLLMLGEKKAEPLKFISPAIHGKIKRSATSLRSLRPKNKADHAQNR